MVVSRDIYQQAGGLDESYILGGYADTDFCLRLGSLGFGSYVTARVELLHLDRRNRGTKDASWRRTAHLYDAWLHTRRWSSVIGRLPQMAAGRG